MLINGTEYSWDSVNVTLLGRLVEGIGGLNYSDNVEKVNHRGRGKYPASRGRGMYEAQASIVLSMKEVVAIQNALPKGKTMQDIAPFTISVSYIPEDGSNVIITDIIENCEFTNVVREWTAGDTQSENEYVLVCSRIRWNV